MTKDIEYIQNTLSLMLKAHEPLLQAKIDTVERLDMHGTIEAMQGKKKVDGIYFGSVMPKPKDVRLYFFPIYTHVDEFADIPEALRKCLKGKSCFHIKYLDEELETAINNMIQKGVELYQKDNLI
jgi:hypothetical protein